MEEKPAVTRDAVEEALRRYQMIWQFMLSLPILYLLLCLGVREGFFEDGEKGFLAPSERNVQTLLSIFAGLALLLQLLLLALKQWYATRIRGAQRNYEQLIRLLWKRLFYSGILCDTASFLGLLYFILLGDLRVMFAFGVASYLLYAQIQPNDRLVRQIMGTE